MSAINRINTNKISLIPDHTDATKNKRRASFSDRYDNFGCDNADSLKLRSHFSLSQLKPIMVKVNALFTEEDASTDTCAEATFVTGRSSASARFSFIPPPSVAESAFPGQTQKKLSYHRGITQNVTPPLHPTPASSARSPSSLLAKRSADNKWKYSVVESLLNYRSTGPVTQHRTPIGHSFPPLVAVDEKWKESILKRIYQM